MIKGVRITARNSTKPITSAAVNYNMLVIPSGKTFTLTDLVVVGSHYVNSAIATSGSAFTLKLFDQVGDGSTAGTTAWVQFKLDQIGTNVQSRAVGKVLHWTNGPEFTVGVTPALAGTDTPIIPSHALFIGGYLR